MIKDILFTISIMIIIILIIIYFSTGFSTKLPPGYRFLCAIDSHKVTLQFPDGTIGSCIWDTKLQAASFARYHDNHKNDPIVNETKKYIWENCN